MRKVIVALVLLTTPLFGEKHPASCGMSSVEAGEGHEQVFDGADGVSTSDSFDVRRLGRLVDQIYVLCEKKCSDSTLARLIPAESRPRVTLLNGAAHDECLKIQTTSHATKATASHKGAVRDALMRGYSRVMVLEEDSEWLKPQDPWTELEWINFGLLIYSDMWDIIRLGYTAFQTNTHRTAHARCNDKCLCPFLNGTRWCTTKHVDCDLRDSHAYLLNRKAMDRFVNHGGKIDMEIFKQFRHTLLIPPVAEQPSNREKFPTRWSNRQIAKKAAANETTRAKKAAAPRRRLGKSKPRVHALYRVFEKSCVLRM